MSKIWIKLFLEISYLSKRKTACWEATVLYGVAFLQRTWYTVHLPITCNIYLFSFFFSLVALDLLDHNELLSAKAMINSDGK